MTTSDLVKALAARLKLSQQDSRSFLDSYIAAMNRLLTQHHTMTLRNFGTFSVKKVAEKRSYLPWLRSYCLLPAHHKLDFKAARKLRDAVNDEVNGEWG